MHLAATITRCQTVFSWCGCRESFQLLSVFGCPFLNHTLSFGTKQCKCFGSMFPRWYPPTTCFCSYWYNRLLTLLTIRWLSIVIFAALGMHSWHTLCNDLVWYVDQMPENISHTIVFDTFQYSTCARVPQPFLIPIGELDPICTTLWRWKECILFSIILSNFDLIQWTIVTIFPICSFVCHI